MMLFHLFNLMNWCCILYYSHGPCANGKKNEYDVSISNCTGICWISDGRNTQTILYSVCPGHALVSVPIMFKYCFSSYLLLLPLHSYLLWQWLAVILSWWEQYCHQRVVQWWLILFIIHSVLCYEWSTLEAVWLHWVGWHNKDMEMLLTRYLSFRDRKSVV